MKTKVIRVFAIIALILLFPASCVFYVFQYKMYYTIGNTTFTFWQTVYDCYIVPYKYEGLSLPTHDYIIVPGTGYVSIFVAEDMIYVISHDSELDNNRCFFSSDEGKYKVFPIPPDGTDNGRDAVLAYCKEEGYPNIKVHLDGMLIHTGDEIIPEFSFYIWLLQVPVFVFVIVIADLLGISPR